MGRLTQFTCLPQAISTNGRIPIPINWGDGDRSNEGFGAVEISVAFGQDMDRGEVVFAEQIGQPSKMPAQDQHVAGRKCDCQL